MGSKALLPAHTRVGSSECQVTDPSQQQSKAGGTFAVGICHHAATFCNALKVRIEKSADVPYSLRSDCPVRMETILMA